MSEPKETPLEELLEQVPIEGTCTRAYTPNSITRIPYGKYCHIAAKRIRYLEAELKENLSYKERLSILEKQVSALERVVSDYFPKDLDKLLQERDEAIVKIKDLEIALRSAQKAILNIKNASISDPFDERDIDINWLRDVIRKEMMKVF